MGQNRGPYNRVRTVQVIVNRSRDTLYTHNCRSHSVNGAMEIRWGLNGGGSGGRFLRQSMHKYYARRVGDNYSGVRERGGSSAQLNSSAELRVG